MSVAGQRQADGLGTAVATIRRQGAPFDGYPAILVQLDNVSIEELDQLVNEAGSPRARSASRENGLASNE